jgi:hypothetical protein
MLYTCDGFKSGELIPKGELAKGVAFRTSSASDLHCSMATKSENNRSQILNRRLVRYRPPVLISAPGSRLNLGLI